MSTHGQLGLPASCLVSAALVAVLAGCAGAEGSIAPATSPLSAAARATASAGPASPPSTQAIPPTWISQEATGVAFALPPDFKAIPGDESDFGEVVFQAARETPGDPIIVGGFALGWLNEAYLGDDPAESATSMVDDWWLPMLGNVAVDRIERRDLAVGGRPAHEIVLLTEPLSSGDVLAISVITVDIGSAQAYLQYLASDKPAAFPGSGFLAEPEAIAASVVFAPDAGPPAPTHCPALTEAPDRVGRLAFVSEDAICVAELATGDVQAIVVGEPGGTWSSHRGAPFSSLEWSPDGQRLAYVESTYPAGEDQSPDDKLIIVNADGSEPQVIPGPPETSSFRGLSWSPDGRRIAAAIDRPGCAYCDGLWFLDVGSGAWSPLATDPTEVYFDATDWSPDGRRIVAALEPADADDNVWPGVGVLDDAGALVATLVPETDDNFAASVAWSQDGRSVAVISAGRALSVMRPDGSGARELAGAGTGFRVRWGWDDAVLLVEGGLNPGEPDGISVLPLDGSPAAFLVEGSYPAWVDAD